MPPRTRSSHSSSDSPGLELGRPAAEFGRFIGVKDLPPARVMLIVGPSPLGPFGASCENGFSEELGMDCEPDAVLPFAGCPVLCPCSTPGNSGLFDGCEAVALSLLPSLLAFAGV